MIRRSIAFAVCVLVALVNPALVAAQPLADRVPGEALVYFAWKGSATVGNGYAGSHLQAVLADAKVSNTFEQLLPQIFAKFEASEHDVKMTRELLDQCGEMLRYPIAVYVEPRPDPKAPVRAAILVQAGAGAAELHKRIVQWRKDVEAVTDDEAKVIQSGDIVALCLGYGDAEPQLDPTKSKPVSLATSAAFASAMKHVDADPFVMFYLDVDNTMKFVDRMLTDERASNQTKGIWSRVRDAAGLNGIHRIAYTGKFEGKDWAAAAFIDAPSPRKGPITLLDTRPVDADVLKMIPSTAVSAHVTRFDFAELVKQIRGIVAAADPDAAVWFDRGMGFVQLAIGRNLMTDILEPLGETWVTYGDARLGGTSQHDVAMINVLDNPAKAQQSANALSATLANVLNSPAIRQQMAGAGGAEVAIRQEKIGDLNVTTVQVPQYSVSWVVADGKLAIGGSPQAAAKAATAAPAPEGLDRNEKYTALVKKLSGGAPITAFSFADLPATAETMYREYEKQQEALRALLANEQIQLPEKLLPSLETVKAHVAPSAAVGWSDAAGLHARSVSPFPLSDLFSNAPTGLAAQAGSIGAAVGVMMPSLNRARETANRVKCASNQHQIAQAILLYGNDHRGQYPPDLGTLILSENIKPETFLCPTDKTKLPPNLDDMMPQQKADWINRNSSYVYVGAGKKISAPADEIILYEKGNEHGGEGMNLTFADGHVEFQLTPQAKQLIEQQKK